MFHMPMSSPMMNMMFGFLPVLVWKATGWSARATRPCRVTPSEQQPASGAAWVSGTITEGRTVSAPAYRNESSLPRAAAKPNREPTASTAAICNLPLLNTANLRKTDRERLDGNKLPPQFSFSNLPLPCASGAGIQFPGAKADRPRRGRQVEFQPGLRLRYGRTISLSARFVTVKNTGYPILTNIRASTVRSGGELTSPTHVNPPHPSRALSLRTRYADIPRNFPR